jgi:hypothetical protein
MYFSVISPYPAGPQKRGGKEVLVPILLTGAKKRTFRGPTLWTDGGDRCAAPRGGHRLRHGLHEDGLCGELLAQLHRYAEPSPQALCGSVLSLPQALAARPCCAGLSLPQALAVPCRMALRCWLVLATSPCWRPRRTIDSTALRCWLVLATSACGPGWSSPQALALPHALAGALAARPCCPGWSLPQALAVLAVVLGEAGMGRGLARGVARGAAAGVRRRRCLLAALSPSALYRRPREQEEGLGGRVCRAFVL